jgi:hypothetical protein
MADGGPVIQGAIGWTNNETKMPTQISNVATTAGGATGLYLFGGPQIGGHGLYAVAVGDLSNGVRSYSNRDDGVIGVSYGSQASAGVRGISTAPSGVGVRGEGSGGHGVGVHGSNQIWIGVGGEGLIGVIGQSSRDSGVRVEADAFGDYAQPNAICHGHGQPVSRGIRHRAEP